MWPTTTCHLQHAASQSTTNAPPTQLATSSSSDTTTRCFNNQPTTTTSSNTATRRANTQLATTRPTTTSSDTTQPTSSNSHPEHAQVSMEDKHVTSAIKDTTTLWPPIPKRHVLSWQMEWKKVKAWPGKRKESNNGDPTRYFSPRKNIGSPGKEHWNKEINNMPMKEVILEEHPWAQINAFQKPSFKVLINKKRSKLGDILWTFQ
jgi:hypothetical protein